jgi:DNA polymerase III psi subunit
MNEAQRRAYLEAMGIEVWISRERSAVDSGPPGRLGVGKGRGSTLLICERLADSESVLGQDVARAVAAVCGQPPLWAWLDPEPPEPATHLEELISSRLVTRVFVLGASVRERIGYAGSRDIIGSARITTVPAADELEHRAEARRALWRQLTADAGQPGGRG